MLNFKNENSNFLNKPGEEAIPFKKKSLGQHFLRNQLVVYNMIDNVKVNTSTTVFEIGCGDGFLTDAILKQTSCKELVVFEIDPEWADFVKNKIKDPRLNLKIIDVLSVDFRQEFTKDTPLVLLANLPYQITFPILFKIQENKDLFSEGVIMVQEEVAQKIVARRGKKYSATTIFLQYHFDWKLLDKIEPGSFTPPPKVFSRTIYFKPKFDPPQIPQENKFWEFVKMCFRAPRQTIKNNLKNTPYFKNEKIPAEILQLRAQQISFDNFLELWNSLIS